MYRNRTESIKQCAWSREPAREPHCGGKDVMDSARALCERAQLRAFFRARNANWQYTRWPEVVGSVKLLGLFRTPFMH